MTVRARMAVTAIIAIGALVTLAIVNASNDWALYRDR
jgi:hypothetical protein